MVGTTYHVSAAVEHATNFMVGTIEHATNFMVGTIEHASKIMVGTIEQRQYFAKTKIKEGRIDINVGDDF